MILKAAGKTGSFVLEAFDTLFNKRDYSKAAQYWSENYIQHSAHIAPGRDGLFNLVRSLPDTLRYENAVVVAEGDYVMLHGRFTGSGRHRAWIAGDIVRMNSVQSSQSDRMSDSGSTDPNNATSLPSYSQWVD